MIIYTHLNINDEYFPIINVHFTIINEHFTIINEQLTIISLKWTIIRSIDHHWEAAPTAKSIIQQPMF